jgi:hypothetical protein
MDLVIGATSSADDFLLRKCVTNEDDKKLNSVGYFMCTGWTFSCYLGPQ